MACLSNVNQDFKKNVNNYFFNNMWYSWYKTWKNHETHKWINFQKPLVDYVSKINDLQLNFITE